MATASIHAAAHAESDRSAPTQHPAGEIRNKILSLLPPSELATVIERCQTITIQSKQVVFRREEPIEFVYFPEDCVISLLTEMEDGDSVEAMTVGSDGFAGVAVFHGAPSSRLKAIGQITGETRRVSASDFRQLTRQCEAFDRLLHRYSQYVFETVAQSAACNRLHVIEQRCARWLLMSQDRVGRSRFDLTQEFLAAMLGVRRPGVTVAMGILEKAGLITHGRGTITVVDRAGLEKVSCECYRTIRDRQAKLITAS
ncbi:MAG TPA: Crp/Fnr family transcriptional regulator [Gemmatimonadaceae bacterium]|nr:Crp/Fnr family transcriptional regulator [Gemmatimonadaceae bacterium]